MANTLSLIWVSVALNGPILIMFPFVILAAFSGSVIDSSCVTLPLETNTFNSVKILNILGKMTTL